jgi:thioredoxin 2
MTTSGERVLLRCRACRTLNSVAEERLRDRPACGKCKRILEFPTRPVEVNDESFGPEVFDWAGVVLVEFWASTCNICRLIEPLLQSIAYRKAGKVKVVKVNIERELALANRFMIRGSPAILVYHNGILVDEIHGALPIQQMEQWIESAISR